MKEKELVTLREKPLRNGGTSLYLDYSIDGVRYKQYLKMYIVPERTKIDRLQNIETRKTAGAMKAKKIVELQNGMGGFKKRPKDMCLVDFLQAEQSAYYESGKVEYAKTIGKMLSWLRIYNKRVALRNVDRDYLLAFFRFLQTEHTNLKEKKTEKKTGRPRTKTGLSMGTINTYSQTLSTLFNNAVRKRYIERNPIWDLELSERPTRPESEREFLTLEEVQKLSATRCGNEQVKRAFLFSCFTGLRLSDIEALTGQMIRSTTEGLEVEMRQQKTQRMVFVPLSSNAASFLPDEIPSGFIFHLPSRNEVNANIRRWIKKAKIDKHITFHCSRHTYATLLLTYGADIYTVSKLMGHQNVATTQVYAKVIDKKRQEAVNLIPVLDIK